jgi:hypothetical protein
VEESITPLAEEKVKGATAMHPSGTANEKPLEESIAPLVEETVKGPIATPEAVHPSRYETLLQFAAIELEGSVKSVKRTL